VAGILSSLPPPPKALASIGSVTAHVGPGPVTSVVTHGDYRLAVRVIPNKAAVPNMVSVAITRGGQPVRGADVTMTFTMLDMEMSPVAYHLPETAPGVYGRSEPALVMVGHWGLSFDVRPPGAQPFTVLVIDRASG
jgi:copper transport protein